jgi:inositol-phosphate phosphatase/L-galactose 1-phosphate phosphatase/histidinol-phosphatase
MNQPMTEVIERYRKFAEGMLDQTGKIALTYFRQPMEIQTKADGSPVTVADRSIEDYIRRQIVSTCPDHGIWGEEEGLQDVDARYVWVVDPIDGTQSFINGIPLWGTLLALLEAGRPILGVIDVPALAERWVGTAAGCLCAAGKACTTSGCASLAAASVFTTSPDMFCPQEYAVFDALSTRARLRRFGGDCYSYAMLAAGYIDAVVEAGLEPYDFLALVPVIEGAGGVVTDWRGESLSLSSDGRVLAAATRALHQEMLGYVKAIHAPNDVH